MINLNPTSGKRSNLPDCLPFGSSMLWVNGLGQIHRHCGVLPVSYCSSLLPAKYPACKTIMLWVTWDLCGPHQHCSEHFTNHYLVFSAESPFASPSCAIYMIWRLHLEPLSPWAHSVPSHAKILWNPSWHIDNTTMEIVFLTLPSTGCPSVFLSKIIWVSLFSWDLVS